MAALLSKSQKGPLNSEKLASQTRTLVQKSFLLFKDELN
jgi:hypothetical protein